MNKRHETVVPGSEFISSVPLVLYYFSAFSIYFALIKGYGMFVVRISEVNMKCLE